MRSQLRQTDTIEEPPPTTRSKQSLRAGKAATGYALRGFARTTHHHRRPTKGAKSYRYPQPTIKSWLPPLAQYSVGTVAQYSIGADSHGSNLSARHLDDAREAANGRPCA